LFFAAFNELEVVTLLGEVNFSNEPVRNLAFAYSANYSFTAQAAFAGGLIRYLYVKFENQKSRQRRLANLMFEGHLVNLFSCVKPR